MYSRKLEAPKRAFFLFGPRATGKSTWLRTTFPGAHTINLLPAAMHLRYQQRPELLRHEVEALPPDQWIVIDEVQRAPALLDEVHYLMEETRHRRFVLTGSSARKLKHGAANLLAGRAVTRRLYPLTQAETNYTVSPLELLRYGSMPLSVTAVDDADREDFLRSYVTTYLDEEVKSEALVRNIGSFARFLEVASLMAGQRVNVSGVARDAQVSRDTARGYFEVLVDTLIGDWLPAYRPRAKVKEVASPKFYWFDAGVLHAVARGFDQPLPADFHGVLLEHVVHHELRSYIDYAHVKGSLGYWATPTGSEVDFVWWHGERMVAIEVKHATEYRASMRKGLDALSATTAAERYIVYRGNKELRVQSITVLPLEAFLRRLHAGDIVG